MYCTLMFLMWAIMRVAMMLPSAALMIETYARVACSRPDYRRHFVWIFTAGYLIVWAVFSGAATIAHMTLQRIGAITPAASGRGVAACEPGGFTCKGTWRRCFPRLGDGNDDAGAFVEYIVTKARTGRAPTCSPASDRVEVGPANLSPSYSGH
jgi:hypothetical protein